MYMSILCLYAASQRVACAEGRVRGHVLVLSGVGCWECRWAGDGVCRLLMQIHGKMWRSLRSPRSKAPLPQKKISKRPTPSKQSPTTCMGGTSVAQPAGACRHTRSFTFLTVGFEPALSVVLFVIWSAFLECRVPGRCCAFPHMLCLNTSPTYLYAYIYICIYCISSFQGLKVEGSRAIECIPVSAHFLIHCPVL